MREGLPKDILGLGFFLAAFSGFAIRFFIGGNPATAVGKENKAHACHQDKNK